MLPARLLTSVLTWCLLSFLHVASVQGAIVQRDDADPSIQYNTPAVIWLSETNKTDQPWFDQSLHYSNSPQAWFATNFTGTSFAVYVGKKHDRGRFLVTIDNQFAGAGDAFEANVTGEVSPVEVYNISGLISAMHQVTVYNNDDPDPRISGGQGFLVLDYLQFDEEAPVTTLALSSTNAYPTQTTQMAAITNGVLMPAGPDSSSSKAGIIGGVVGAVAGVLLVAALFGLWWLIRRKKQGKQGRFLNRRESIDDDAPAMSEYSVSSPYNHASIVSAPYSPALSMSDGTPSAERQSFLPAGAAGRYSIQHSVQPRAEEEELSDHWQQDTDANAGLRPPAYDNGFSAAGPSSSSMAPSSINELSSSMQSTPPTASGKGQL